MDALFLAISEEMKKIQKTRNVPWCPSCIQPLNTMVHDKEPVWSCTKCKGVFIQHRQLQQILQQKPIQRPQPQGAQNEPGLHPPAAEEIVELPTKCPWCARVMGRHRFGEVSSILIDTCEQGCGIWLNDGELESIEAWHEFISVASANNNEAQ